MKTCCRMPLRAGPRLGYTLLELIITIVLLGIVMIPVGVMALEYAKGLVYARHVEMAGSLARMEMSKVNNLPYDDATLASGYDRTFIVYEGYPYDVRRTVSYVDVGAWDANLKKVQVRVYPTGSAQYVANMVTYIADVTYGT